MNNACPECGAVYAVAEKDIGRRIACKKCSASLIVAEEGLRVDDAAAATAPKKEDTGERERSRNRSRGRDDEDDDRDRGRGRDDDDDDRPSRKKRERDRDREETPEEIAEREARAAKRAAAKAELMNKLKGIGDVATWLYSIGLILTIYAKYAGDIDSAKVAGRQGDILEEQHDQTVLQRDIQAKMIEDKRMEPTSDEKKKLEDAGKEWTKRQAKLSDRVKYAEASQMQSQWMNIMLKLLGFILLAFGSIGYLKPEQGPFKRILGGVTILLILAQVVGSFKLAEFKA